MKSHKVKQGECMITIAAEHGYGGNWQALYDHDVNKDLREKRPDPFCLMPGDIVNIPDEEGGFKAPTNQITRVVIKRPKAYVAIKLIDAEGNLFANVPYELHVGKNVFKGNSDANGIVEQQVPYDEKKGELVVWPFDDQPEFFVTYDVMIASLSPMEHETGQQARLRNLGFDTGPVDGNLGLVSKQAIEEFQLRQGINVNKELDDPTKGKLLKLQNKG